MLYAWQPSGHGELSFFVEASSLREATDAVNSYIEKHMDKDDGHYIDSSSTLGWGTDYYELTVRQAGAVFTNEND